MAKTIKLEKENWENYFNEWDKRYREGEFGQKKVQIEIVDKELGDQIETYWQSLVGLAYDPKDDDFEVVAEKHDHIIHKPKEIYVEELENGDIKAIEVVQEDGIKHIILLENK